MNYTIAIKNVGGTVLENVAVFDYVPLNTRIDDDVTVPASTCSVSRLGDWCYGGETLRWSFAQLQPNESRVLQVPATVGSVADGTLIINRVEVLYDGAAMPVEAERTVVVEDTPVLALDVVTDRDPVAPGEIFTYTLTYGNRGSEPITDIVLEARLPAEVDFDSASEGGVWVGDVVQWDLGALAGGASGRRTVSVLANADLDEGAVLLSESRFVGEIGPAGGVRNEVRVQASTPLMVTLTANPDPVRPGPDREMNYTLVVKNVGGTVLENVAVRDYVPTNTTIDDDVTVPASACNVSRLDGWCKNGEALRWSFTHLKPNESQVLQVPGTVGSVAEGTPITNRVEVLYDGAAMPVEAERTIVVEDTSVLALDVVTDRDPVAPGEIFTYTLTYGNRGSEPITGIVLEARLPAEVDFDSASEGGAWLGEVVQWDLGALAGGASGRRTVSVIANADLEDGAVLLSESRFVGEIGPAGGVRNEVRVQASMPLVVTMTANPDPVRPGPEMNYTIAVKNVGGTLLENVTVRDYVQTYSKTDDDVTLPASACSVSRLDDWCYPGEALRWSFAQLQPGEGRVLQVPATVNSIADGTPLTNRVEVHYDGAAMPVEAERTVVVEDTPVLALDVVTDRDPVVPGEIFTYTLTYGNRGSEPITGVVLEVRLPAEVGFDSASEGGAWLDDVVRWDLGALAAGASGRRTVSVLANADLDDGAVLLSENRFVGEIGPAGGVRNEVRVQVSPPLMVTLTANPDPVRQDQKIYYRLTLTNIGAQLLEEISVRDYVPSYTKIDDDVTEPASKCTVSRLDDWCYVGEALRWTLVQLATGESTDFFIPARVGVVPNGTPITNRAEVSYAGAALPFEVERTAIVDRDASPALFGNVTIENSGLANVLISVTGPRSTSASTNTSGDYAIAGLLTGDYTVTPTKVGYEFDPPKALVAITETTSVRQDFRACAIDAAFSGIVLDATTNTPLDGVSVIVDESITTITAADGTYTLPALSCGEHTIRVVTSDGYATYLGTLNTFYTTSLTISLTREDTVLGLDVPSGIASDPVNTATGNYVYQRRDLAILGIGFPLRFDRTYNSRAASTAGAEGNPLGYGWSHSFQVHLSVDGDSVTITWGDGHTETFTRDALGDYIPQYGVFDTLLDNGDGTFSLIKRDRTRYDFDTSGRLAAIIDKNNNTLGLTYTGADLIEQIDTAGRVIALGYDTAGRLTTITDPIGRTVTYTYDLNGDLIQATDPNGNITTYTYDASHQLLTVVDPRGNTVVSNTYDAANRVVTYQTDAKGNATSFAYQQLDRITTITDALGHVTVHQHDSLLRLIKEEDARGAIAHYEYDTAGNRIAVTDKNGNRTQYGYDERGNVTSKLDALGNLITLTYDEDNNPLSRTDALGNLTQFAYDANGNLIETTNALGQSVAISYLPNGRPETLTDALGNVTTNAYDTEGNLISITDALGQVTHYTYDGIGRRLSVTDPNGHTTETTYDDNGNRLSVTDPLLGVISFTYDENDNKLSRIDRNGHTTAWAYDEKDLKISETDPLSQVERYAYDELDRRISKTDRRGNTTAYAYDAVGNLIEVTDALNHSTHFSYDLNGNRLSRTDANNHTTRFTYDALNRRTHSIDALNNAIITDYDANGNRISRTDRRGYTRHYEYDALNRRIGVTNALGHSQAFGYDANGNRISQTNALGHTTTSSYDALNRLTATTDPLGHTQTNQYDPGGRVIAVTDANDQSTQFAYDARDRLTQVTDAASGSVTYGYDANGNRTGMTDPNGNTTTYTYDALNRRISQTEPLGHVTSLAYDANGNLSQRTDPKGQVTNYVYDSVDRLTSVDYATEPDVGITYDAVGNRLTLSDGLGATSHSYDELDRRTAATDPFGQSVGYGYDANGNRTSLVYPDGKTVTYAYDGEDRMTSVTDWLGNVTIYSYDAANRLTGTLNANATTTEYVYDAASRLTGLANAKSDASVINAYSYTLDPVGNHLSEARTEPLEPQIPNELLTVTHDAENRLIQRNATSNSFDANGNLIAKGADTYTYDAENRLIETNIDGTMTQYQYDGVGNRYSRARNSVSTRFVLDTNTSLTNVLAETNSTGTIQAYNVYGKGLIARISADNSTAHYHYDLRGSTIALTDNTQTIAQQYAYDPFGSIANASGTQENPFGFLGKHGILYERNNLNYIRARYYDAELQRFVNKDAKFGELNRSQTLNRYAYAVGNPVRLIDISGFSANEGENQLKIVGTSDINHMYMIDPIVANSTPVVYEQSDHCLATYGLYGGLNWTGGVCGGSDTSQLGKDVMDELFRTHDKAYQEKDTVMGYTIADYELLLGLWELEEQFIASSLGLAEPILFYDEIGAVYLFEAINIFEAKLIPTFVVESGAGAGEETNNKSKDAWSAYKDFVNEGLEGYMKSIEWTGEKVYSASKATKDWFRSIRSD